MPSADVADFHDLGNLTTHCGIGPHQPTSSPTRGRFSHSALRRIRRPANVSCAAKARPPIAHSGGPKSPSRQAARRQRPSRCQQAGRQADTADQRSGVENSGQINFSERAGAARRVWATISGLNSAAISGCSENSTAVNRLSRKSPNRPLDQHRHVSISQSHQQSLEHRLTST